MWPPSARALNPVSLHPVAITGLVPPSLHLTSSLTAAPARALCLLLSTQSYANITGVPAVMGLYGAFLPVLVYSLFGSSRQLGVGPVAVTSGLIFSGLNGVIKGYDDITDPNDVPKELAPVMVSWGLPGWHNVHGEQCAWRHTQAQLPVWLPCAQPHGDRLLSSCPACGHTQAQPQGRPCLS